MANHHLHPAIRLRSLANVLDDLRDARADWIDACGAIQRGEQDADDRAAEAETRMEDLREDFDARFVASTGLTWGEIMKAVQEAVL